MRMRKKNMPSPSDHERLLHIQEACDLIIEYTAPLDLAAFQRDRKSQLSIERLLEIMGEAAKHISEELKASHTNVPWREITDLRNVVSHEYFQLRVEVLWGVAQQEIPKLSVKIRQILEE